MANKFFFANSWNLRCATAKVSTICKKKFWPLLQNKIWRKNKSDGNRIKKNVRQLTWKIPTSKNLFFRDFNNLLFSKLSVPFHFLWSRFSPITKQWNEPFVLKFLKITPYLVAIFGKSIRFSFVLLSQLIPWSGLNVSNNPVWTIGVFQCDCYFYDFPSKIRNPSRAKDKQPANFSVRSNLCQITPQRLDVPSLSKKSGVNSCFKKLQKWNSLCCKLKMSCFEVWLAGKFRKIIKLF